MPSGSAANVCAQVNPRYVPQLQTVLTWPTSIGIVGGRPGSSLYFVGCQGDNVLFLDPHETQPVRHDKRSCLVATLVVCVRQCPRACTN